MNFLIKTENWTRIATPGSGFTDVGGRKQRHWVLYFDLEIGRQELAVEIGPMRHELMMDYMAKEFARFVVGEGEGIFDIMERYEEACDALSGLESLTDEQIEAFTKADYIEYCEEFQDAAFIVATNDGRYTLGPIGHIAKWFVANEWRKEAKA